MRHFTYRITGHGSLRPLHRELLSSLPLPLDTLPPPLSLCPISFLSRPSASRIAKKSDNVNGKDPTRPVVVLEPRDQIDFSDPRSCPFISPRLRHLRAGRAPRSALPFRSIFIGPLTHQLSQFSGTLAYIGVILRS